MEKLISAIEVNYLGEVPYLDAWESQKALVSAHREAPDTVDRLLLLQHPPTYTLGSSGKLDHLLIDEAQLSREGISVHQVNRGGDITYHGPGQLVGYPILNLKRLYKARGFEKFRVHGYVRELEEVIIQALAHFDLFGWRYDGYTGVWVGDPDEHPRKIAAIGIHINSKGISSHGFALNVEPNMTHFEHIVPCGIQEHGVTSIAKELGQSIAIQDVIEPISSAFQTVFETDIVLENGKMR